jgi:sigma-B regulation protein RsbU (phosphoserine phosphatase)
MQIVEKRAASGSFTRQCYHSDSIQMARSRTPDASGRTRWTARLASAPGDAAARTTSARDLLLHSWAGRLFLAAAAMKVVVALLRQAGDLPAFVRILNGAATIGLAVSVGVFVWRLFVLMKRRLLWRLRRRLILSYIFIGVVPALLIVGFALLGAWMVTMNLSAYFFKDGYDDIVDDARLIAQAAAAEIGREPADAAQTIARVHRNAMQSYRGLTLAFTPLTAEAPAAAHAGAWEHLPPPQTVPPWLRGRADGFRGTIAISRPDARTAELIVRAAVPTVSAVRRFGYVIVDVPVDGQMLDVLYDRTRVRAGDVYLGARVSSAVPGVGDINPVTSSGPLPSVFSSSVTFLDYHDWETGAVNRATVAMTYRLRDLYNVLSRAQSQQIGPLTLGEALLVVLVAVAVLFLIIECVALIMGLALARSITSSIHELTTGTERVRQGDFTHRIKTAAKDQLGELAGSFNQMTGSIENLLQTAAEKKRLEEELRIARQIQMSLLPRGPLDFAGLTITALCVPAREVGGDYYDFFRLPQGRLGILIADVSGKGTSAALYMAELKGLVLSLSQIYFSPRQLLIEVNRIISENLDSRSFITMTYAVVDVAQGSMTYARAGHTPMVYLPAPGRAEPHAQVLVPSGMVVGLRIEGAAEKFAALLEEETIPLGAGDVIVLYTDGITEAMNLESDLFGDSRLSRIVEEHGHLESAELRERILREIEAFVGEADQHDDMTMVLLKVEPAAAARVAV